MIDVDIVSDFVCPWCWLGWKEFSKAAKGFRVEATWRPYQLDPLVPREGRPYRDYMRAKFGEGPNDAFKAMRDHLEAAAPAAGIEFKFSDLTIRPNTLDAHRLTRWAQGQDLGTACATALFRAYFQDVRDIGEADVLADIAGRIGMDADLTRDLLLGDADEKQVLAEAAFYRGLGVSGVPTYIYNGETAVQGAQDAAAHRKVMKALT